MTGFLLNLGCWLAGGSLGALTGMELRTRRKGFPMRDDRGYVRSPWAIGAVVVLTAIAAILSGVAAKQSDDATDEVAELSRCTQDVLTRTVRALNERTEFSDATAKSRKVTLYAQADLVDVLLDPKSTDDERTDAARRYRKAIARQQQLDRATTRKRDLYPYPTAEEIRSCP